MKKTLIKSYFIITFGVFLVAVGYYFFLLPQNLVTGGVTGIAIIVNKAVNNPAFSPSILIYILNGILLIIGLLFIGKDFFYKTVYGSLMLPTIIFILELCKVPSDLLFTIDQSFFNLEAMSELSKLLITIIFGGCISGIGLGLCFRNNATTGGTDVLQKLISKYFHLPYSKTVYITDGLVVLFSLFVFGLEKTLYSLLCIILVANVIDYVSMGGKSRRTAFIISKKSNEIQQSIYNKLDRGVTIIDAHGGYSHEKYDMLVCTLSKNESYMLRDLVTEIDPAAFTFYVSAKEVFGDGFE